MTPDHRTRRRLIVPEVVQTTSAMMEHMAMLGPANQSQ